MGKNTTLISDIVERICGVLAEDVNKTASMEQQLVVLEDEDAEWEEIQEEMEQLNSKNTDPFQTALNETSLDDNSNGEGAKNNKEGGTPPPHHGTIPSGAGQKRLPISCARLVRPPCGQIPI